MSTNQEALQLIVQTINTITVDWRKLSSQMSRVAEESGMGELANKTETIGSKMQIAAQTGAKFANVAHSAAAKLFGFVKASAESSTRLLEVANGLGITVESLQKLKHHADLSGVSTQTFEKSLKSFSEHVANAASGTSQIVSAFQVLGVEIKDNSGTLKPMETLLGNVADGMSNVADPAERSQHAIALFGSTGTEMIRMLKGGSEAINTSATEMEKLGIITKEQAEAAVQFSSKLSSIATISESLGRLKTTFSSLADTIKTSKPVWDFLPKGMLKWQEKLTKTSPALAKFSSSTVKVLKPLLAIDNIVPALAIALEGDLMGGLVGLLPSLAEFSTGLIAVLPGLGSVVGATMSWTAALLANPLTWIVAGILAAVVAIAGAAYLVYQNWDAIIADLSSRWEAFSGWISEAVNNLIGMLPDWVKGKLGLSVSVSEKSQIMGPEKPSALTSQKNQISGGLRVSFDNLPAAAKISDVSTNTSGFALDVDAGYAMGGA